MTPGQMVDWFAAAAAFVGAVGSAVAVLRRWIIDPMERRHEVERAERAEEVRRLVAETVAPINDKLDRVVAEVTFNGGSSLKDAVRRIDIRLTRVEARLEERENRDRKRDESSGFHPGL